MNNIDSYQGNLLTYLFPEESGSPSFYVGALPIYEDLILSPMDGYSDLPFRILCRELGSAMSYTEFIKVEDFLFGLEDIETKLTYLEEERPIVFQIYGDNPDTILEAALRLRERGPDVIDVNMGCPSKSICNRGAGVGLMRTPDKIAEIFHKLSANLDIPVTGKIRLGWDDDNRNYLEVARIVEGNGGQLLAVHGRTKVQGYRGRADWDAIAEIVDALSIPVLGNGDIRNLEDIQKIRDSTGCAGVMIARGAISNPWIFSRKNREDVAPSDKNFTALKRG
jgi:nifR3 family TIM-barrel protein